MTLLHPPGGLVGGDRLSIGVEVGDGRARAASPRRPPPSTTAAPARRRASSSVSPSPAAARSNGCRTRRSCSTARSPSCARASSSRAGASFIGIDLICFGLPARAERFARGRCRQRLEVWRGDCPLFIERGDFDGGAPVHDARWGLGGAPIMGTLVAAPGCRRITQALAAVRDARRGAARRRSRRGDPARLAAPPARATRSLGALLPLRRRQRRARRALTCARPGALLRPPLLGRPAVAPRIWAT